MFGNILPLKELSAIAHENGARFFVDGAQGAGVVGIDIKKLLGETNLSPTDIKQKRPR